MFLSLRDNPLGGLSTDRPFPGVDRYMRFVAGFPLRSVPRQPRTRIF